MQNSLLPAPQNPGASLPPAGAGLTNADLACLRSSLDSSVSDAGRRSAPQAVPGGAASSESPARIAAVGVDSPAPITSMSITYFRRPCLFSVMPRGVHTHSSGATQE